MKNLRRALFRGVVSLILCFSMLLGTTYAWFTDSVTSSNNIIKSGKLDLKVYWTDDITDDDSWRDAEDTNAGAIFDYDRWEPGYTCARYIKIVNNGSLAFKYFMNIIPDGEMGILADVIDVYYIDNYNVDASGKLTSIGSMTKAGTLADVVAKRVSSKGELLPKSAENGGEVIVAIAMHMQESAGNEYQGASIGTSFSIEFLATQLANEEDSFGSDYDKDADYTVFEGDFMFSQNVETENNIVKTESSASSENGEITTTVKPGTKVKEGVTKLEVAVSALEETSSNLVAGENELLIPVDVHVEGVAEDNTVPLIVALGEALPKGLNIGNYTLYHVENGVNVAMTAVSSAAELDVHNEFYYDPATGNVTVAMATFSEVTMVANTENKWTGTRDYTWYDADATELTIANADQLAGFGAIVGGMAKDASGNFLITYEDSDGDVHHNDTFADKTVTLLADINLGDKESENDPNLIFYPIGYWNSEETYEKDPNATEGVSSGFYTFQGTFDGNGNTISNFYQNTWEMKGDHDWYDAKLQYFRDGMGLFGRVLGGTIKNLTVDNFSCDSEIGTTGVIAAYADSKDGKPAVFENITITNCNPRVYNIGNGGIVGCAGWYSRNDSLGNADYTNAVTFRNITVDQTNKISALWGSWGVSCAGILGQYYPNSSCGIKIENCHVAAIIDVNNDVCSNYQYYWYRYAGMFIGTIRANKDVDGYTIADTTGVFAKGCTYTMGNWNEYWYCEIVANSLASYTHDHQFSRLDNIYDLSEISDDNGETWKKEGHFALLNENRDIVNCYHIFKDSEGNLYRHFHDVADESNPNIYEDFDLNGDGELNDLKEDRQRYFIPFNQLMTGLDMGIRAFYDQADFERFGIDNLEFTLVEDGPVKSEVKFEALDSLPTYKPDQTIKLGDIVEAIVDETKIAKATLYATVSPAVDNDNTNVSATYSLDTGDWAESTITFGKDCSGAVKIVINDYFYCTPTVIVLNEKGMTEKFTANIVSDRSAYTQITLGTLFGVKDGETLGNVTATVTDPKGNETTVSGTSSDWETKTIDLTKDGTWTVVIKDDDAYCATTIVTFTVNKADKFVNKFDKDFLYRVGNRNTVTIGTIFGEVDTPVKLSSVNVTIETVAGDAAGTFTSNATWANGTVKFSGTGVVKVTITADCANPVELCLEVVEATNYAGNTGEGLNATSNNVVLLTNIGSGFTVSGEYTFYGNGFTLAYTGNGQYLNNGLKQGVVMVQNGGTLDNLCIRASIYPTAFMYFGATSLGDYVQQSSNPTEVEGDKTRYYYQLSAVATYGDATISNCYIYGGRTNIYVNTGNVTIEDSVLECGVVANVQIQSTSEYAVTLEDVTTMQYQVNATVGDTSKVMLGAGVLVGPETTSNPKIVLNGAFKQYNWVTEDDKTNVSGTMAQMIIQGALDATAYNHTVNGETASNLGIIYMNEHGVNVANNTGLPYVGGTVTMKVESNSIKGNVYSLQSATAEQIYSDYANADRSTVNGDYVPRFDFDLGDQAISYDGSEDTRYLYGDKNGVTALYQDGAEALTLDLTKLASIYKYDGVNYTVTAVCKDSNGNALTATNGVVTLDAQGSYTLEFTANDNLFYDKNGNTITKSVTRTYAVPLTLTVKEANVKNAEVKITKTALDGVYTTVNLTDYKLRVNFLDCIFITDYDNKGNGTSVTLSSNIASATLTPASVNVFTTASTITITYKDGRVLTVNLSKISGSSPGTKTATVNTSGNVVYFITDGALDNKPTASSSQNKCTITSVSFKGNSGSTVTNDTDVTVTWALGSSSGCFAEGTLVALADGTQKPIEEITFEDELLAWDFNTGAYAVTVPSLIDRYELSEQNVINLKFSDGTVARMVVDHGFFDVEANKFVFLNEENVGSYIGHTFVKAGENGTYQNVEFVGYEITVENVAYYSIQTAFYNNCITEGMFTLTAPPEMIKYSDWFEYFEIGEGMKYDEEKMQADIETYGLYTYEEFADLVTYEQFMAFNGPYLKVLVGRGVVTYEQIIDLIATYVNPEAN